LAQLPTCLVGMEACGGAHYWAREIAKLGHEVKLMSPRFVRPYVKVEQERREMLRPSARLWRDRRCDSLRPRASLNRTCLHCTEYARC
jgi:transposase